MANFINQEALNKELKKLLEDDLNGILETTVEKVLTDFKGEIKRKVAARMISLLESDYNVMMNHGELRIMVKLDD